MWLLLRRWISNLSFWVFLEADLLLLLRRWRLQRNKRRVFASMSRLLRRGALVTLSRLLQRRALVTLSLLLRRGALVTLSWLL